ncbi:MAG TPA: hypothetical protein EYP40_03825, partial [Chromatiales bacterium]|nr:hypothetical protein [Chromatiales bacterium]
MYRKTFLKGLLALGVLGACSSKFKSYNGPQVTRVLVYKSTRNMYLLNNDTVLKSYVFDLGFAPVGEKIVEGDGKTPEGDYIIDRRNPD